MDDGEMSAPSPAQPTTGSAPTPSEAELSRMARDAVRQPPDPRLDRQLARMGLADSPVSDANAVDRSHILADRTERLERRLRRVEIVAVVLLVAVVVLAAVLVVRTSS